jgi:hypothetical protein
MQILKSNYGIKLSNYNKPTPLLLKYISDFLLVLIPVIDGLMMQIPDFHGKEWVVFGWNAFAVIFKMATKFIADYRVEKTPVLNNIVPPSKQDQI